MKVRCISNLRSHLSAPWQAGFSTELAEEACGLKIGNEYIVYAIKNSEEGVPGYLICDERYDWFPKHYPAEFFEIVDPAPSRYWVVGLRKGSIDPPYFPMLVISFPEWAGDPEFYYWLVDRSEPELSVWQNYKLLIEMEQISNSIE